MKKTLLLFFLVFSASTAFAEVELNLGYGYGSKDGGFFHSQLGWKQRYAVPLIITADYDVRLANNSPSFQNLDLNTSIYYKRFTFGVGWGYQWYKSEEETSWSDDRGYMYIKPNISLNFKYMKFSLESHIFFERPHSTMEDKVADVGFTISFRDEGAVVALAAVIIVAAVIGNDGHGGGGDVFITTSSSGNGNPQIQPTKPSWGELNLDGGVYE